MVAGQPSCTKFHVLSPSTLRSRLASLCSIILNAAAMSESDVPPVVDNCGSEPPDLLLTRGLCGVLGPIGALFDDFSRVGEGPCQRFMMSFSSSYTHMLAMYGT